MDTLALSLGPCAMTAQPEDSAVELQAQRDRACITACLAGRTTEFDSLVKAHQRGVFYLVRRYVRAEADAADVTQQAFVRAFRALAQYRGDATPRSWLYRIAINCALSWLRDHKREAASEITDNMLVTDATGASDLVEAQRKTALRAAIAQLPPKQRQIVELRVFDDLSFREVAQIAECNENTAKVNFHHALRRLRELLPDGAP
ncbi:MAG: sigma-70 family RNA polymerase sigma factor [Kofleriaceae bacterium]|nr:sigma-70 family RNA polymerase sigma factor [Kofleriaceae bacterium]